MELDDLVLVAVNSTTGSILMSGFLRLISPSPLMTTSNMRTTLALRSTYGGLLFNCS